MEIEVTRLVLRDPATGTVRAVLECADPYVPEEGVEERVVRLQLRTEAGAPELTLEIDETGHPRVYVGQRDQGATLVLRPDGIDVWRGEG